MTDNRKELCPEGFEIMHEGDDGWCDWIHPTPGYMLKCCDCGIVHEMEFSIVPSADNGPLNDGESDDAVIIFRARRTSRRPVLSSLGQGENS